MKAWSTALAALTVALSLISFFWPNGAQAHARPLPHAESSSQALKDLQGGRKNPDKQLDSCFRRIPPSNSNPIQNKLHPPTDR